MLVLERLPEPFTVPVKVLSVLLSTVRVPVMVLMVPAPEMPATVWLNPPVLKLPPLATLTAGRLAEIINAMREEAQAS